jgi:hypothetical protein
MRLDALRATTKILVKEKHDSIVAIQDAALGEEHHDLLGGVIENRKDLPPMYSPNRRTIRPRTVLR